MIEINFLSLIQNSLAVARTHRDRLFRTRLSILTPLSDGLVRNTKEPIYGRRMYSTSPPSIGVYRATDELRERIAISGARKFNPEGLAIKGERTYRPERLATSGARKFNSELELLQEFQDLHQLLLLTKKIPSTRVPALMTALSKFPVLGVGGLAREVGVSKDTAKRWLTALVEKGKLEVREFNGMNQYAYARLIDILDMHVRFTSKP